MSTSTIASPNDGSSPTRFRLSEVSFAYPARYRRVPPRPILGPVTLDIPAGACVAIAGASGSGKTTFLNLLSLLWDGRFEGQATYYPDDGPPLSYSGLQAPQRNRLRAEAFGFVLQSAFMLPNLSCLANVALPLRLARDRQMGDPDTKANELIDALDTDQHTPLREVAGRAAGKVSGGQRQRFAVLRAIIHQPTVLFADEPLSSLDPFSAEAVLKLFTRWRTESPRRTLLIVSHDAHRIWEWGQVTHYLALQCGVPVGGRLLAPAEVGSPARLIDLIRPPETGGAQEAV